MTIFISLLAYVAIFIVGACAQFYLMKILDPAVDVIAEAAFGKIARVINSLYRATLYSAYRLARRIDAITRSHCMRRIVIALARGCECVMHRLYEAWRYLDYLFVRYCVLPLAYLVIMLRDQISLSLQVVIVRQSSSNNA